MPIYNTNGDLVPMDFVSAAMMAIEAQLELAPEGTDFSGLSVSRTPATEDTDRPNNYLVTYTLTLPYSLQRDDVTGKMIYTPKAV